MILDATFDPPPVRSKLRLRFSLLALFVFMTLACLALAWLVQPKRFVATALFEVASVPPKLLEDAATTQFDEREYELFKNTQLAKLKSYYVLRSAIRNPGIAALPVLAGKRDPAAWLQEHLDVEFPLHGEILAIRLRGLESQADDMVQIVDAVAKAYEEEVIYAAKAQRLAIRDLKAASLRKLREEIKRKMQLLNETRSKSSGQSKHSADVRIWQLELDVLTGLLREGQLELERMDMESNAPARIRQIQPAMLGRAN
jgi:hypothetical protein